MKEKSKLSLDNIANLLTIALDNGTPSNWSAEAVDAINQLVEKEIIVGFNGSRFDFGTSDICNQASELYHNMLLK